MQNNYKQCPGNISQLKQNKRISESSLYYWWKRRGWANVSPRERPPPVGDRDALSGIHWGVQVQSHLSCVTIGACHWDKEDVFITPPALVATPLGSVYLKANQGVNITFTMACCIGLASTALHPRWSITRCTLDKKKNGPTILKTPIFPHPV